MVYRKSETPGVIIPVVVGRQELILRGTAGMSSSLSTSM